MFPTIRRILYPTDLSPDSEHVFRYAAGSALKYGAKIVILHVFESLLPGGRTMLASYLTEEIQRKMLNENIDQVESRIKEDLQAFYRKELEGSEKAGDIVESIEVREGYPADVILKMADERDCDVIIMGTHGKGLISHTFLGSVSKRVLRRTRKPVFIIPFPEEGPKR